MRKRYYNMLLCAGLLALQLPADAQQKKAPVAQKSAEAINTANWVDFDLGAYTDAQRIPLTVKLPANAKLKKETEEDYGYQYNMELNKKLTFYVTKLRYDMESMEQRMTETRAVPAKCKKRGQPCKILIDEPDVFLISIDTKTPKGKIHLMDLDVSLPGDKVHYSFRNYTSDFPDTYSDAEWIQMARSFKASVVQHLTRD